MKTTKLVLGILSIVLFLFIVLQSCAVGVVNTWEDNGSSSGTGGLITGLFILAGGITSIAARNYRGGAIACAILYGVASLIGFSYHGSVYKDLNVWSFLSASLCIIHTVSIFKQNFAEKANSNADNMVNNETSIIEPTSKQKTDRIFNLCIIVIPIIIIAILMLMPATKIPKETPDNATARLENNVKQKTEYNSDKLQAVIGSTETKTLQTEQSKSEDLEYTIVENHCFGKTDYFGSYDLVGIVVIQNTGASNLYLESGSFDVEDPDGHIVGFQKYIAVYPQVIAPGEKAVYYDSFSLDNGNDSTQYKIVPKINAEKARVPVVRLKTYDTSLSSSTLGRIKMIGRVENITKNKQSNYEVAAILYNKDGEVIGIMHTSPDNLEPGEKIGFEMTSYADISIEDVSSYDVISYPHQYQ